jgi:hypothetical protein
MRLVDVHSGSRRPGTAVLALRPVLVHGVHEKERTEGVRRPPTPMHRPQCIVAGGRLASVLFE